MLITASANNGSADDEPVVFVSHRDPRYSVGVTRPEQRETERRHIEEFLRRTGKP